MDQRTVDVTFPVTLRLDIDVARNLESLRALRDDLEATVFDACTDPNRTEALKTLTPDDDGDGSFDARVGRPTVELPAWLNEEGLVRDIARALHGPSD